MITFEFVRINPLAAAALEYVNRFRKAMGMEPLNDLPKGGVGATTCPIANALNHNISVGRDSINGGLVGKPQLQAALKEAGWQRSTTHPQPVREFIRAHDSKKIADYWA